MAEKIITKSFERLLDKGRHRGFITYEELGKSLGKRNGTEDNIEKAFIIILDEKITLVEKKSQYQTNRKKETVGVRCRQGYRSRFTGEPDNLGHRQGYGQDRG